MGFHRVGAFAAYFGVETDNTWRVGGWSMGGASYRLLHEGNSFVFDASAPTSLNAGTKTITCGDLYAARNAGSGVVYLGTNGANYLYNDSARFNFNAIPVVSTGPLGIGMYGANPLTTLHAKLATGINFYVTANGANGTIGMGNDALSAWIPFCFQAATYVAPLSDNSLNLGDSIKRWKTVYAITSSINTSDIRLKKDVQTSRLGLDFIESLRPVSYKWIVGENVVTREPDGEEMEPGYTTIDGEVVPPKPRTKYKDVTTPMPGKRTHWGLIAQEVKQAVDASGVEDFAGYVQIDMKNPDSELGLRYSEFISPLIKAVQELSARVKALEAQIGA
jgi:hypothetical protein